MKLMRYHIALYLVIALFGCKQNSSKEKLIIPKYSIFVPNEIDLQVYSGNYTEKIDSILIVTDNQIIIYQGEFAALDKDTIINPIVVTGGSGFHFRIIKNETYKLEYDNIIWNKRKFSNQSSFNFQWWDYLSDYLDKKNGTIVVGGP